MHKCLPGCAQPVALSLPVTVTRVPDSGLPPGRGFGHLTSTTTTHFLHSFSYSTSPFSEDSELDLPFSQGISLDKIGNNLYF